MGAVVPQIKAISQPLVLVAVNQLDKFKNPQKVGIEDALQIRAIFDQKFLVKGLKSTECLGRHLLRGFCEGAKSQFGYLVMDSRDSRTPAKDDAGANAIDT
jgi:hypothetical protein